MTYEIVLTDAQENGLAVKLQEEFEQFKSAMSDPLKSQAIDRIIK